MVSAGKKGENKEKREGTLLLQVFRSHISDVNAGIILFPFRKHFVFLLNIEQKITQDLGPSAQSCVCDTQKEDRV